MPAKKIKDGKLYFSMPYFVKVSIENICIGNTAKVEMAPAKKERKRIFFGSGCFGSSWT